MHCVCVCLQGKAKETGSAARCDVHDSPERDGGILLLYRRYKF